MATALCEHWSPAAFTAASPVKEAYRDALQAARPGPAALAWRLGRFDRGTKLLGELARRIGPLEKLHMLDLGAAHGGDACAAVAEGMRVTLTDLNDHDYAVLKEHLQPFSKLRSCLFDLNAADWPLPNDTFHVVLAMAVIDHIRDLPRFFASVASVLRPGGVAVVDTATALRSVHRDGHYGLPGVSLLPMRAKRFVAERLFHRRYRSSLANHVYYSAGPILRAAASVGLTGSAHKYADSPIMRRLKRWPAAGAWRALATHTCFDYVLLFKPTSTQRLDASSDEDPAGSLGQTSV